MSTVKSSPMYPVSPACHTPLPISWLAILVSVWRVNATFDTTVAVLSSGDFSEMVSRGGETAIADGHPEPDLNLVRATRAAALYDLDRTRVKPRSSGQRSNEPVRIRRSALP
jgi:hypothetical protein